MNRTQATQLTRNLLDQHELRDWKIRLITDIKTSFLGKCVYAHKVIYLNAHHIDTHHEELIKDTILHEIAHALTPHDTCHGIDWQNKAKAIGAKPNACSDMSFNPEHIDAIRSGGIVEIEIEQEIVYKPKYTVHMLKDLCPTCGKIAKELKVINSKDKADNDIQLTILACGHIIKKIIPKATPYDKFVTQGQGNNKCIHEWNPERITECMLCGAFRLFPFQVDGCIALEKGLALNKGFALFDEMGLGKTVMPLAYFNYHHEKLPFLLVGKSGIKYQYFKEIVRWLGPTFFPQVIMTGKDALLPNLKAYIISYDLLRRFDIEKIKNAGIKTVILDECQAIKNPDSTRTQEVREIVKIIESVIPTSGTFWKNRGSEAFVALNMLDAKKFYSFKAFKDQWVDTYFEGGKTKEGGIRNPTRFREYIKDIAIRREREDVMKDLPLVTRNKYYCKVDENARNAYNGEIKNIVNIVNEATIGGEENSFTVNSQVMQSLIRMRQIVGIAKVPATLEFVEEFLEETNRKLVIFVHHKACGEAITVGVKKLVSEMEMNGNAPIVLQLTSDVSSQNRMQMCDTFNNSKRAIMIASTLASGEGLNLQSCSDCIMHERQWNPANEEQAEGRFIRIGQKANKVTATYTTAEDTVDSQLDKIVHRKRVAFLKAMSEKGDNAIPTWNEGSILSELVAGIIQSYNEKKA